MSNKWEKTQAYLREFDIMPEHVLIDTLSPEGYEGIDDDTKWRYNPKQAYMELDAQFTPWPPGFDYEKLNAAIRADKIAQR